VPSFHRRAENRLRSELGLSQQSLSRVHPSSWKFVGRVVRGPETCRVGHPRPLRPHITAEEREAESDTKSGTLCSSPAVPWLKCVLIGCR